MASDQQLMTYAAAMARPRSSEQTRADLLAAARSQFAREGFERVTIRSVAAEVGVDPALVIRYFTNKAALFAEAARVEIRLPDLAGLAPAEIGAALVNRFFDLFEDSPNFLALLRAASTSEVAAAALREALLSQAEPALAAAAIDQPARRAALVGSQMIGLAFVRYVLDVPAIGAMSRTEVLDWVGPTLARYLTTPVPATI
jgi:AcrR family transcriptional regulator